MPKLSDFKSSGGGLGWEIVSSATNAEVNKGYLVDSSSSNISITLPSSPAPGDQIGVKDYKGSAKTNNITIVRNGNNVEGQSSDYIIDVNKQGITLVFTDSTQGWVRVADVYGPAVYS